MKLLPLLLILASLTTSGLARRRRRLFIPKQSSYNRFMAKMALNFEKAKVETLGAIFKRHVQQLRHTQSKQVELVFLIDSSGTVGSHYFYEELRFVKNLLADFTVDMNSTRVSVITFSSPHKIFRHIDYLTEPTVDNHKCRLLQEDIPSVDYTPGGTHTLGAFLEAEKVLRSARAGATKAIFLMTDGYSNGGDPRPVAQKLKAQGVRIFTFGIRDGFVWELQRLASEPKNETCYILDSFEEFEALAKRALHTDLQSGSYISQSLSKCGRLCKNGGKCCHDNATCSCGTYTGKYECLCKPGFYGMGVGKAGCKPCPYGSYKNYTGLGACSPCPDEHQLTPLGADSISLCKCKKGYRNFGSEECKVFRCPKLSPPEHGYFVNNKCNNVFNAACGLRCNSGYELRGSSLRSCQEDGQWSGQQAECIMKTCPSLPQPKNGHMICSTDDFSYSTVCRFTCNGGYQLVGSRKRTCLAIAFWTGIATRCREITCPPLVEIKDGIIQPATCTSSEVVFGTTCQVSCRSGYMLKGPHTKQCTPDGTWMTSEKGANLCVDESPPVLHCPQNIDVSADEKDSLTPVFWAEPVPVDNSGLRPVIISEPSVSPGSKFPIGKTTITYIAKDLSNNVAKCQFVVHVIDKTPPRIDKCLSPSPIVSKIKLTAVDLDLPEFSDNSGKPVEVAPSRRPKDLFPIGKTRVTYTAFDSSNNNNTCVVDVVIVPHLCMTPDPPANGDIICKKGKKGVTCHIACKKGFAFVNEVNTEYTCQFKKGVWKPQKHFPFQDCSAVQASNDILQPASITLTSDISCKDQKLLSELVENLEEEVKNKLNEACDNDLSCTFGGLSFVCEDDEDLNKVPQIVSERRRRRSIHNYRQIEEISDRSKISVKFSLSGSLNKNKKQSKQLETQLMEAMNKMLLSLKKRRSQTMIVKGKSVAIQGMSYNINDPEYKCEPGSIVVNKRCVSCPVGTFCNTGQKSCGKCPKGTFQDRENQTNCNRCPDDKSTVEDNCRNVKDCKALCGPGSFSPTGLEPCETCHHGFYQSDYGSRKCIVCKDGKTTERRGSVSHESCMDLCPPGYVSRKGFSPCSPCPTSSYQPKVGQTECLRCPGGGSTPHSGAIYITECVLSEDSWQIQSDGASTDQTIPYSICDFDNPCKNGGICEPKGGSLFACRCQPGFQGETCGQTVDPCKGDPCLNGGLCLPENGKALCHCLDGFTGDSCEVNVDDCSSKPCHNEGICVDGISSFSCNCQPGFTGSTCETLTENCDRKPCLNGGICNMDESGFTCTCKKGFSGELCEQDIDECVNVPCENDATCIDLPGGFSCTCIPGYEGTLCEQNIDECKLYTPCENGGLCEDSVNDYICNCPDGFTGKQCQTVLSPYYQLDFGSPSVLDYAEMSITQPLSSVTASFWIKTRDDENQGTPFSYAVNDQPDAFTITDYKSLNIYINGEEVNAIVALNSGEWQHVVFTWSSATGDWKIYRDGLPIDHGYDLSTNKPIPANGIFIVGQEQDEVGGGFSASETFIGSLTQLNIWNRSLSSDEIKKLRFSCEDFQGNVIGWPKVQAHLKGSLIMSPSSFCDDCPKPENLQFGSAKFTGVRPNDEVSYSCEEGYNVFGRSEFKCLATGAWEANVPSCQPVFCDHPGAPDNGYIIGKDFSYKSRVYFRCDEGYELEGPESSTCNKYEEWDFEDFPECFEIQCDIPLLSANTIATVTSESVKPGTVIEFSCTPGNKLLSKYNSSLCQEDGTFDKSVPTCDPERCPTPPLISNGEPKEIKKDYGVGETVHYECSYGYRLNPDVENRKGRINCLPSGDWEDELPECEEIICPDPPFFQNARAVGEGRTIDTEVIYQCNPGYTIVGRNSIVCQKIGEWTSLRLRCRPISCGSPQSIPFGSFTGEIFTFGSTVSYQCDQGYTLNGNQKRSCQEDEKWQGENPSCLPISCGQPQVIEHGQVKYEDVTYSESAVYVCDPGYSMVGAETVVCEASRQWKPNPPLCSPRSCSTPPDVADATYNSPFKLVFNTSVSYTCNTGHILSGTSVLTCNENALWIPSPPVCNKVKCPEPSSPESGTVSFKDLTFSSIVTYDCENGYKLKGLDSRTCQADGKWSDEMPKCEASACQAPTNPVNGRIDFKDLSIGSIVVYSCDKGFRLEGESVRRCRPDLTLTDVAPTCNAVDCGNLSKLNNGKMLISTDNTLFGTVVSLSCDTGFYLVGAKTISCGPDGKWTETTQVCKPVECPKVSTIISNGRLVGSSFTFGSVVTYHCDEGYTLDGPANRTCQANKEWDNLVPSCEIVLCPQPRLVYGSVSTFERSFGTKVQYSCRGNYRLEGPTERTCLAHGRWSGQDPKCLKIDCAAPKSVDNAESKVINETAIQYSCKKGYNLIGSAVRVCGRDEIWRPDPPHCVSSSCEDLSKEILLNGQILFTSADVGEEVEYNCNEGYRLRGENKRKCLSSGLWEGNTPICAKISCGHPGIVLNGHVFGSDYTYDAIVSFECNLGYKLNDVESIRCLKTGFWEDKFPYCERVYCPELQDDFRNGEVYFDSNSYLSIAEYSCKKGFILNGIKERECLGTGEWSGSEPECVVVICPEPEPVRHGIAFGDKDRYEYGDEIRYECIEGYYSVGKDSRYCTEDGTWTEWIPQCLSIKCPEPPFLENGYFEGFSATYKSTLTFFCFEGFKLIGESNITCQLNGKWSGSGRHCEHISCGEPPNIENAHISQTTNFLYEANVFYSCTEGYLPFGNNMTHCLANRTWSYLDFSCKIISCPSFTLSDIPHGVFKTPSFTYKDHVVFACEEGYLLTGEKDIECQSNGLWSSSLPSCTIIQCPPLGILKFGSIALNSLDYGSVATVTCLKGYHLKSSSSLLCLSSGQWNDSFPLCEIVSCPTPPTINNGIVWNPQKSYVFENQVEYICDNGYELQGPNILRCTELGTYDIPPPTCHRIPCSKVEDFAFGRYAWVNETFINYSCNSGFFLQGDGLRECALGGIWNGEPPVCKPVPCPVPSKLENGEVSKSDYTFGNYVLKECNIGFNLDGDAISICQEDGTWSGKNAKCLPISCGEPATKIENGYLKGDVYTYKQSIEYVCLLGFELKGKGIRTCLEDGEWSDKEPKCIRQSCIDPDPISNGFIHGNNYLFESFITYNCSKGFTLIGNETRICESSLQWSGSAPLCVRAACPRPQIPANALIVGSSYLYEDVIQISCNRGFLLEGPESRICQDDKSWSGVDPVCKRIYCPVPAELKNAFSDYEPDSEYVVDSEVTFFCNKGYIMNGTGQRFCEQSGFWSTNFLECYPVSCTPVNSIENGVITSDSPQSPFTYTANLFFSCNPGFGLEGSPSVECGPYGDWSQAIPTCLIMGCEDLRVQNGIPVLVPESGLKANFIREEGKYYAGDNVRIQCNAGYEVTGISNTSCSLSGQWLLENFSCLRIKCLLPLINNGNIIGSSYLYEDEIQVSCNRGFLLDGPDSRTCQADKSWSGVDPICKRIYCPVPAELKNAFSDNEPDSEYVVDSEVTFFCNKGYIMNGTGQRFCEQSGFWSTNFLECYPVSCTPVNSIENGVITSDSPQSPFTYTANLLFSCNPGFKLEGSLSTECGPYGDWSQAIPTCLIMGCEDLQVQNGILVLVPESGLKANFIREEGKYYAGDHVKIKCDIGHELNGFSNMNCSLNGLWSSKGSCNPVTCQAPVIVGAKLTVASVTYQEKIAISCVEGLDLIGSDELTCGPNSVWEEKLPRCESLACGSPRKVLNAVLKGENFKQGDNVFYECKPGYELIGNNILTCGPTNQWLGSYPSCVKVDCGEPDPIYDSYLEFNNTKFEATAIILCIPGYELVGKKVIVCGAESQWIFDSSSQCIPLDCGSPPNIPHGSVSPDDTTFGSLAIYTCDIGYFIQGTSSMYCDEVGNWGSQIPVCSPVICQLDPPKLVHATSSRNGSQYQDKIEYHCDEGYKFTDPSFTSLTCGEMGNWKGKVPSCIIIDCGAPPVLQNAFSILKKYDTVYLNTATYICLEGYESNSSTVLTCGNQGKWEGNIFPCTKVNCLKYPVLSNGEYSQENGTLFGAEVVYRCFKGYEKTEPNFIRCTSEGKWTQPSCTPVDCSDPPQIPNGQYQLVATTYQSKVSYTCQSGYLLTGKPVIECLNTGFWSPATALCKPLNCQNPPNVNNADVTFDTTLYGGKAKYLCNTGFTSNTPMSLACDDTGKWTGILPKCEVVACSLPQTPANGFVNYTEITYLSVAIYGCNPGNKLIGEKKQTCLENETWSDENPLCSPLDCPQPLEIENGKMTLSGKHFGAKAHYFCSEGYVLEGEATIFCNEKGSWSNFAPKCKIIDCKDPPQLQHAKAQYNETTFNSVTNYICVKGYSLEGSQDSVCQENGKWSDDARRDCKLIFCPTPPPLVNGLLVSFDKAFGSRAVYKCLPGYKSQTLNILTCGELGLWQGDVSPCNIKSCPDPVSIDHGSFQYDKPVVINTVVQYYCEKGYVLIGAKEVTCNTDERWWPELPYCKQIICPTLDSVPHSTLYQKEKPGYLSVATFECQEGYTMRVKNDLVASKSIYTCNENGQWEGDSFDCNLITCPFYPPLVEHASYELTNGNSWKSNVRYICEPGYIISTEHNVFCDQNGQWNTAELPFCKIVTCGFPPTVEKAYYEGQNLTFGSHLTYHCHPHHKMIGENSIKCLPSGTWSSVAFICEAIQCNLLPVPDNGRIVHNLEGLFIVDSFVNFACNEGFALVGAESSICLESGQWSLQPPLCQKIIGVCEEKLTMDNAKPPAPGKFPGDSIVVQCKDGYIGEGDMLSNCQNDGSWLLPTGKCQRVSCGRPEGHDRRSVRVFGHRFLYGDSVRYMCRYGFSPVQNPPVIHCLSSGHWDKNASCVAQCKQTCLNGGRCLGLNRCKCMPGWAGFKCHMPNCIFPCLNGGNCVGPYKCSCPHRYQGSRCERAVCPRPCQNGGRCLRHGKCHCLPGFHGTACENRILPTNFSREYKKKKLQPNQIYDEH